MHLTHAMVLDEQEQVEHEHINRILRELAKHNLVLHTAIQTQAGPTTLQIQALEPGSRLLPRTPVQGYNPEEAPIASRLIHRLKTELTETRVCSQELVKYLAPHADNLIAKFHKSLDDSYRFFIIDSIAHSIQFLKNHGSIIEFKRICIEFNQLTHNGDLKVTTLANTPDIELFPNIQRSFATLHQLESFQLTVACNDIAASIRCAIQQGPHDLLNQMCTTFNELLKDVHKDLPAKQLQEMNITPEQLVHLHDIELNTLITEQILNLDKHFIPFKHYVHQCIQPYVQDTRSIAQLQQHDQIISAMQKDFEHFLTPDSPYAQGKTVIDRIFDRTREMANLHLEKIRTCSQTIDELQAHLRSPIQQDGIHLENADYNIAREIEEFLSASKQDLITSQTTIARILDEITATTDEIQTIIHILENISRKEATMIRLAQGQATDQEHAPQAQQGLWRRMTSTITPVSDKIANKAISAEEAINNAELARMQQTLECTLAKVNSLEQRLRDAIKIETDVTQNIQTLCAALDSDGNPQFHLYDQQRIEDSMAKDLLASNLREQAVDALQNVQDIPLLGGFIKYLTPKLQSSSTLQPTPERAPHYPLLGRIFFGALEQFNRYRQRYIRQPAPGDNQLLPLGPQQAEQLTWDDRYTLWLINTHNPRYILYDIAKRTRVNTGRFTYLIKKMIHTAEVELLGGPYRQTESKQDPEELRRYPEFKEDKFGQAMYRSNPHGSIELDNQEQPIQTAIRKYIMQERKHHEQPGERYNDLMDAVTESIPFEHFWLVFKVPPCTIRIVESILRTASQRTYPEEWLDEAPLPAPEVQQHIDKPEPFKSTSATSFIWNGLKTLSRLPISYIQPILAHTLQKFTQSLQRGIHILTGPFADSLPYKIVTHATTATTSYIQPKMHAFKIQSARKVRSILFYFAANQMRLLESKIRQQKPISDDIVNLHSLITNHSAHGAVSWFQAEVAHNAPQIRTFAQKYKRLDRIDPIMPIDSDTGLPDVRRASIRNYQLRKTLGSFVEGWEAETTVAQH